jgi:hypothetical protein
LEKNINARNYYEKLGYLPDGESKWIEFFDLVEMRYFKELAKR